MNRRMSCLTTGVATLAAAGIALAQVPESKTPPTTTPTRVENTQNPTPGYRGVSGRVEIGETAPGFELTNAEGKPVRLSSFGGTRILLCFADRRETISSQRAVAESLGSSGVRLVVIAHDSPRSLKALAGRENLTFEMLSDPTGEVSAIYGCYDAGISSIRPGYVLVGRGGVVRMAILGQALHPDDLLRITRYTLNTL